MATERSLFHPYKDITLYASPQTITVAASGTTACIPAIETKGQSGVFAVNNSSANSVTVFPRYSLDGTTYFEIDNGSGTAMATGVKQSFPWIGKYRYVKLDAQTSTQSIIVCYAYTSNQ
jgi:hypothetical protein